MFNAAIPTPENIRKESLSLLCSLTMVPDPPQLSSWSTKQINAHRLTKLRYREVLAALTFEFSSGILCPVLGSYPFDPTITKEILVEPY